MTRRWIAVFAVTSVAGIVMSLTVASGRPILASRWSLLGQLGLWAVAWGLGVVAAFRMPARVAVGAVLAVGIVLRLAALAGPPATSDDLYRYSWDGRVQAAGLDPYSLPPSSAALAGLREPWLWPDASGCAALDRPPGCTRINRPSDRTIYPPVAELWFAGVYRVAGIGARYKAWQVAGLLTELAALALLVVALRRWKRDPRWVALYALSPAPVLEVVNNGHVDGLAVVFVVAALAAATWDREVRRDIAVGALIGLAVLVKLYPGILLVAVAGIGARRWWVSVLRASVTAGVLSALAYLPHVLRVGVHVLGYLPGYLTEEHYTTGARFLLAAVLHVPPGLGGLVSGLGAGAAVLWVVARRPPAALGATVLIGAVLLAASPVQPWYAVSLLAVATVAGAPWWAAVVVAGYPYFFAVILANRHAASIGEGGYALALAVVVSGSVWAWRSSRPPSLPAAQPPAIGAMSSTRLE